MGDRREIILKAAERLFEHYGHGKTTIADVAREAQVGVGTVYLEFESKEAIIEALSASSHDEILDAMVAARDRESDYARRFHAVFVARTRAFLRLRKKGQHACELLHCKTESVRTAHERFRKEERAILAALLEDGQRMGTFGDCDAETTAALVQRAFASLSPPWIFLAADDAARITTEMCELLLDGLLNHRRRKR